ncbi:MAG TPA: hypothetical protein DCG75_07145 [Bacteroidales bacterium]|jgi:phosphopantetheine--protein transferase-like protein|nr:hypothetical protein [Bacteroidales bacterium]
MVYGCGIDIEEIERFNKHYFENGRLSDLIYDLFTSKEIENFSVFGKEAFLKGFCFKEAFYKAVNNADIDFKDVEIIFSDDQNFEILKSKKIEQLFLTNKIVKLEAKVEINKQYALVKLVLVKD